MEPLHVFDEDGVIFTLYYEQSNFRIHIKDGAHEEDRLVAAMHEPRFGIDVEDADNLDEEFDAYMASRKI